jgi:hypothetical protein
MISYELGLKPSTPSKVAHRRPIAVGGVPMGAHRVGWVGHPEVTRGLPSTGSPTSAGKVSVARFTPRLTTINGRKGPLNQNGGSCSWHSYAAALYTAAAAQGSRSLGIGASLPWLPSPDFGYKTTRALERAAIGGALYDLEDTGAELADAEKAAAEYGVVPFGKPSSDGKYTDVDLNRINDEPSPVLLQEAGLTLVTGPYKIDPTDPNLFAILKACLAAGIPLWVGFYCDLSFQALRPGQIATAPIQSDTPVKGEGGHAVFLSEADDSNEVEPVCTLENSWGDWCDGGTTLVGMGWLQKAWEIWPVVIQHVAPRAT